MYLPDIDLAALTSHISYMFKVIVGLDLLGDFSSVQGLSYTVEPYLYNELGRNHSPVQLPFGAPGQHGELRLEWGMVVRSKLFNWINAVKAGGDFRKNVHIVQLSQQRLPIRIYQLTGAWPKSWEASDMTTERSEWTTESLVLAYDQIDMFNMAAVAMAGGLLGSPVNAAIDDIRPPGFRPRQPGSAVRDNSNVSGTQDMKRRIVTYTNGRPEVSEREDLLPPEPVVEEVEEDVEVPYDPGTMRVEENKAADWYREKLAHSYVTAAGTIREDLTYEDFGIDPDDPNADELLAEAIRELKEALAQDKIAKAKELRERDAAGTTEKEGASTKNTAVDAATGKTEKEGAGTKNTAIHGAQGKNTLEGGSMQDGTVAAKGKSEAQGGDSRNTAEAEAAEGVREREDGADSTNTHAARAAQAGEAGTSDDAEGDEAPKDDE